MPKHSCRRCRVFSAADTARPCMVRVPPFAWAMPPFTAASCGAAAWPGATAAAPALGCCAVGDATASRLMVDAGWGIGGAASAQRSVMLPSARCRPRGTLHQECAVSRCQKAKTQECAGKQANEHAGSCFLPGAPAARMHSTVLHPTLPAINNLHSYSMYSYLIPCQLLADSADSRLSRHTRHSNRTTASLVDMCSRLHRHKRRPSSMSETLLSGSDGHMFADPCISQQCMAWHCRVRPQCMSHTFLQCLQAPCLHQCLNRVLHNQLARHSPHGRRLLLGRLPDPL